MRRRPFLTGMLYVPLDRLKPNQLAALQRELRVNYYDQASDTTRVVKAYDRSKAHYIGVPRQYGLRKFRGLKYVDLTCAGSLELADAFAAASDGKLKPRDEKQREFFDSVANVCKSPGVKDFIANAKTGTGKTVCDINATLRLQRPTLVIVPTNRLKQQWIGNHKREQGYKHLVGDDFVDRYVGVVQQSRCDYRGRAVCIGLLPSLARRNYGPAFYRYFGKVTFDEVHKCAAPVLSKVLSRFPARVRVGYTATNKEGEGADLLKWHLGPPLVVSKQAVKQVKAYIYAYSREVSLRVYGRFQIWSELARLRYRNRLLTSIIFNRGWKRQRNIVVLSDRVKQLEEIGAELLRMGVPEAQIGFYVGQSFRHPTRGVVPKPSEAVLDAISDNCKIIMATYGIFALGIDIARLDMAVEATPRGDIRQAVGRLTRKYPGKSDVEWYALDDQLWRWVEVSEAMNAPLKKEGYRQLQGRSNSRMRSLQRLKAKVRIIQK